MPSSRSGFVGASPLRTHAHELADTVIVERLERVALQQTVLEVPSIIRPSTSSRLNPRVICVRSLVPKLKKSASIAMSSARIHARGVSIIVPMVTSSFFLVDFCASSIACWHHRAPS